MIYKGYKIEKNEFNYFEAYSLTDCDEPIIHGKTIEIVKNEIDEKEIEIIKQELRQEYKKKYNLEFDQNAIFCAGIEVQRYIQLMESKLTQPQQTVSDEEIKLFVNRKSIEYGESCKADSQGVYIHETVVNIIIKELRDKLQAQTNEGTPQAKESELIELLKSLDEPISADDNDCCHIKIYCDEWNKIKELITQFRKHKNNKDDNKEE